MMKLEKKSPMLGNIEQESNINEFSLIGVSENSHVACSMNNEVSRHCRSRKPFIGILFAALTAAVV